MYRFTRETFEFIVFTSSTFIKQASIVRRVVTADRMPLALSQGGGANGGNCPPTGAKASLEIDANPMSFHKQIGG